MRHYEIRTVDTSPPSYETHLRYAPNILIVGETGVGKSSVINLIAGEELAEVSSVSNRCTLEATSYDTFLPDDQGLAHHIRLFDTVGLNEPWLGRNDYLTAIEKAHALICQLQRTGGIRHLLFCIRGGRVTTMTQHNYNLFCNILCQNKVPVSLVVTGLENEPSMEGWWENNAHLFHAHQLSCVSHVCITATHGLNDCYMEKYYESQARIWAMLSEHITGNGISWKPDRVDWWIHLAGKLWKWSSQVKRRRQRPLTVEAVARHLHEKCMYSLSEAVYLAGKMWAKRLDSGDYDFVKYDDN